MKKAMLKFVIPCVAALAIVGSGYAVWYFNGSATTTASMNLKATGISEVGDLTMSQNGATYDADTSGVKDYLVLDQDKRPATVSAHGTNGMGVVFAPKTADFNSDTFTTMNPITVTYTPKTLDNAVPEAVYFRGFVAVPSNIDKYIMGKSGIVYPTQVNAADLKGGSNYSKSEFGKAGMTGTSTDGYTYYPLTLKKNGTSTIAVPSLFSITYDLFYYRNTVKGGSATIDTSIRNNDTVNNKVGYTAIKTAVTQDGSKGIRFFFSVNYKA